MNNDEFNEIMNLSDTNPNRAIRALTDVVLKLSKKVSELEAIQEKAKKRGAMAALKTQGPIKR